MKNRDTDKDYLYTKKNTDNNKYLKNNMKNIIHNINAIMKKI